MAQVGNPWRTVGERCAYLEHFADALPRIATPS